MKEILFRGQIRRHGEKVRMTTGAPLPGIWVYGGAARPHNSPKDFAIIYTYLSDTAESRDVCGVYADTVTQYTGIDDKDGTKVFEGDIVETFEGFHPTARFHEHTVVFRNGSFGLLVNESLKTKTAAELMDEAYDNGHFVPFCKLFGTKYRVIGNIFDGVTTPAVKTE